MGDVRQWLDSLGLGQYAEVFEENALDLELLPDLTEEHLRHLGVTALGHRLRILAQARAIPSPSAAPREPLPTATGAAERRQLTVMFCDLVGSTALSTRLDPEDLRELMTTFQDTCRNAVSRYGGFIARYMGDGVLVYFGYPQAYEDGAERAVRAGLALTDAVANLRSPDGDALRVRTGIATGVVVVGDLIGEGAAHEQSVVGETPNLAARLQALAGPGTVLVSDGTRRLLGEVFELRQLGNLEVKGFTEPVAAYVVTVERASESRFEAHRRRAALKMVGRDEEFALLTRRWRHVCAGEGQVALVSGEAGIGKSRFVRDVRDALEADSGQWISLQCSPYHTDSALYPVIRHLIRAAEFEPVDDDNTRLDKLEVLLGAGAGIPACAAQLLATLLGIDSGTRYARVELDARAQRDLTLRTLLVLLIGIARSQPVILAVEDAHWIDPTTLDLIELTRDSIDRERMLILLTARPGFELDPTGPSNVTRLILDRLGRHSTLQIIASLGAGKPLPDDVLEEIIERTDGVPLFVEELTKTILESGVLRETDDAYVLDRPPNSLDIPSSLHDSLLARLDRLPAARDVAQTAACIGREFELPLLVAVARVDQAELRDSLDELVRTELVFRRRRSGTESFAFKHALVRDAAYASLLKSRRQAVHADIAEVLEGRFQELVAVQPELVAHHFTESNRPERAVDYWERAGRLALGRAALVEGIAHLSQGVRTIQSMPDGFERNQRELRLQILLAEPLKSTHGHAAARTRACLNRAQALSEQLGDDSTPLEVLRGQWAASLFSAEHRTATDQARRFLELANRQQDPRQIANGHRNLAISLFLHGDPLGACEYAERLLELCRSTDHEALVLRSGGENPRIKVLAVLSNGLQWLGRVDQAARASEEAIELSGRSLDQEPRTLAFPLEWSILGSHCRRDHECVVRHTRTLARLAEEKKLAMFRAFATMSNGWLLSQQGKHAEGLGEVRRGLRRLQETDSFLWQPLGMTILAQAVAACGRPAEGVEILDDALAMTARTEAGYLDAELNRLKGVLILAAEGLSAAARAQSCFHDSLAVARRQQARFWELRTATSLARLCCDQGERGEAAALLAPVYEWFSEGHGLPDLAEARALLDELA